MTPEKADSSFIQAGFSLLQKVSSQHLQLLVGITRQGGAFALSQASSASAYSAGISGLVKTADKEWEHTHCKALDIPISVNDGFIQRIVTELLSVGPLEVGLTEKETSTLKLKAEVLREFAIGTSPFNRRRLSGRNRS